MKRTHRTYTPEEVNRLFRVGNYTSNGVAYDDEPAGPDGARFTLIDEGQSKKELRLAEFILKSTRDVVGAVMLARVEKEEPCEPS